MSKQNKNLHHINPEVTPVWQQKADIQNLRVQHMMFPKFPEENVVKLLNTAQWLFEVLERLDSHNAWWIENAPPELTMKFMVEMFGIKPEDFEAQMEELDKAREELKQATKKQNKLNGQN